MAIATEGVNRIMIYGPEQDGTSIPRTETAVIKHFKSGCLATSACIEYTRGAAYMQPAIGECGRDYDGGGGTSGT
jgi:hypothetical protein